ncbi:uncharacterized protein SEPMUDRAFT_110646 [Sphaerulina musiva SO2202]|uniref:Uncharacterized protein n=1 Tax=Sphaerulina musiva (strain SO2202) TaxID=692275 RepID=M3D060_SPHMS|nr:uncharacterized protein SEPMUDRAFT_110646 [Sphaerulina musiva SO2202]EMF10269.1 hypothetical protein SEPMUDRAFT_110646 [Sphaerulina musiva SO2202]
MAPATKSKKPVAAAAAATESIISSQSAHGESDVETPQSQSQQIDTEMLKLAIKKSKEQSTTLKAKREKEIERKHKQRLSKLQKKIDEAHKQQQDTAAVTKRVPTTEQPDAKSTNPNSTVSRPFSPEDETSKTNGYGRSIPSDSLGKLRSNKSNKRSRITRQDTRKLLGRI